MKLKFSIFFLFIFLFAGGAAFSEQCQNINFDDSQTWNNKTRFDSDIDGYSIEVNGYAGHDAAGVVLSKKIALNQARYLVVHVKNSSKSVFFNSCQMLKVEVDDKPLKSRNFNDRCSGDTTYIKPRDGKFTFKLKGSTIRKGKLWKINLFFWRATLKNLKLRICLTK